MAVFMIYASIGVIFLGVAYAKSAGYGQELETFFLIFQIVGPVAVFYLKCLEHNVTVLQCLKFIALLPFSIDRGLSRLIESQFRAMKRRAVAS